MAGVGNLTVWYDTPFHDNLFGWGKTGAELCMASVGLFAGQPLNRTCRYSNSYSNPNRQISLQNDGYLQDYDNPIETRATNVDKGRSQVALNQSGSGRFQHTGANVYLTVFAENGWEEIVGPPPTSAMVGREYGG